MNTEKLQTSSSKKSNANNASITRTSQALNSKVLVNNKSSLKQKNNTAIPPGHKKFNSSNKMPSMLDFPIPPYYHENLKPIVTHDFSSLNTTSKKFIKPQHQYGSSKQVVEKMKEKTEKSTSKSPFSKQYNKNERSFQTTTEDKTPRSLYNQHNSSNVSGNLLKFNNSPNNRVNRLPNKRGTDKSENKSDINNISSNNNHYNNYNNTNYNNNNTNNNVKVDFNMNTLLEIKKQHCKKKLSDNRVDKFISKLPKKINNSKNNYQRISNNVSNHMNPNSMTVAATNSSVSENNSNAGPKLIPNVSNVQGIIDDRKFSIIDIPYSNQIVEEKKYHRMSKEYTSISNSQLNLLKTPNMKSLFILISNK